MIRCIDVRKVYRQGENEIIALDGVSLDITRGEFAVIMGPSGSGKSTLLHLIGGLDRPTSGELLVDQRLVGQMADDQVTLFRRTKIGFIFQFFNLLPTLTPWKTLRCLLFSTGDPRKRVSREPRHSSLKSGWKVARIIFPKRCPAERFSALQWPALWHLIRRFFWRRTDRQSGLEDRRIDLVAVVSDQSRERLHDRHGHPQPGGRRLWRPDDFFSRR